MGNQPTLRTLPLGTPVAVDGRDSTYVVTHVDDDGRHSLCESSPHRQVDHRWADPADIGRTVRPLDPWLADCSRCADEADALTDDVSFRPRPMFLCPDCGNKRCPRATDHRHACTGSNDPGQPGSAHTLTSTEEHNWEHL